MEYEVQAAVSALGYLEGDIYHKEADCYETVKDLIRYLRRDGENRSIRKYLGESNIVQNDLVPILTNFADDLPLFDATLRLLINLTQPAAQCFNGKIPSDTTNQRIYLEINNHLKRSKRCFIKETFFTVLHKKLENLLKLDWENRQEEDKITIERLLTFIKNVLTIPPAEEDLRRTDTDITLHDQILWTIHRTGVEGILLTIAESDAERHFHLLVLEIICLILKEHKAEDLAKAGCERSELEKRNDELQMLKVHASERARKLANLKRYSGRHTNFAGSYVAAGIKAIADAKDLISHKVVSKNDQLTLDNRKKRKKFAKNRAPLPSEKAERKSALTVRLFLKQFAAEFLARCYVDFVSSVRVLLGRVDRRQLTVECCYVWCLKFFVEFARCTNEIDNLKCVLDSISVETFHYVLMQMNDSFEMMKVEKFEAVASGKRFHNALQTYKELFATLTVMEKSSDEELIDAAMEVKKHVFYVVEYGELFLDVLKRYNPAALSKTCLADLIECTHVYMKLFEFYCHMHGGGIKVQKKRRKRIVRQRKKAKADDALNDEQTPSAEDEAAQIEKENVWDSVTSELSAVLQGHVDPPSEPAIPFDPLAEHGFDEKIVAKVRIQERLKKGEANAAVALLKACREIWAEDVDLFGTQDMEPEDEFLLLRSILFEDLPKIVGENCETLSVEQEQHAEEEGDNDEDEIVAEELEDIERRFVTKEIEFTFLAYLQRFAHIDVLKWYVWLLTDFETNPSIVNHSILKLLHRICYQLKSPGLLYQASLFRVFQKVTSLPSYKTLPGLEEIVEFARHLLREFFSKASKNPKMYMEILFWKNMKEAYELDYGYGSFKVEKSKKSSSSGTRKRKRCDSEEGNEKFEGNKFMEVEHSAEKQEHCDFEGNEQFERNEEIIENEYSSEKRERLESEGNDEIIEDEYSSEKRERLELEVNEEIIEDERATEKRKRLESEGSEEFERNEEIIEVEHSFEKRKRLVSEESDEEREGNKEVIEVVHTTTRKRLDSDSN